MNNADFRAESEGEGGVSVGGGVVMVPVGAVSHTGNSLLGEDTAPATRLATPIMEMLEPMSRIKSVLRPASANTT